MGYYTYYNLDVMNSEKFTPEQLINASKALAKIMDEESYADVDSLPVGNPFLWLSDDSMKWYEHDDDMIKLSKEFPEMTFRLFGEGEDHEDMWVAYYRDGRASTCYAHIIYDPMPDWVTESY